MKRASVLIMVLMLTASAFGDTTLLQKEIAAAVSVSDHDKVIKHEADITNIKDDISEIKDSVIGINKQIRVAMSRPTRMIMAIITLLGMAVTGLLVHSVKRKGG